MLRLADATETTAKVWVRRTESGVMTVECNGQTFTGTTLDPATEDGCGICEVAGLVPNTSYPFTVYVAGVEVDSGTLRTMPEAGSTFTIGTAYCFNPTRMHTALSALQQNFDLSLAVFMGDNVYLSSHGLVAYTDNGETVTDIGKAGTFESEAQAMAAIGSMYRFMWKKPEIAAFLREVPTLGITDDHERPGDNWDWSILQANDHDVWATTQQMVDDMGLWCRNAVHTYFKGNPSNSHASNDSAWADDKQLYFDKIVGDAHLIFLESIEYRDGGAVGLMAQQFGATQYDWLKSVLLASTSPWKIIFCGVPVWNEYGSADNEFNTWLDANEVDVVFTAGDLHASAVATPTNMLCVRAGPVGAKSHTNLTDGYGNSMIYKQLGYYSTVDALTKQRNATGYITVHGAEYLEIGMIDDAGNEFWKCRYDADGYGQEQMRFG